MTAQEIKQAVDNGKTVYYQSGSYKVIKSRDEYLIKCGSHCIGLTWADGITLNGLEKDFFCRETQ